MIFLLKFLLAKIFLLLIKIRIFLYKTKILKQTVFDVKIISIGNLSFGGTGKTPLTLALSNYFSKNYKVAVLEKGYKSKLPAKTVLVLDKNSEPKNFDIIGDEANLIDLSSANTKLIVSKNKTLGVKTFLENFKTDLIIVDDGFSHLKLARNLDIVLIDSNIGFNDSLFPLGKLRVPYTSLAYAEVLIFTKSNFISEFEKERLANVAFSYNRDLKIFFVDSKLIFKNNLVLTNKDVIVMSAIAEPSFLYKLLESENFKIVQKISYQDHYTYTKDDIKHLEAIKLSSACDSVLTTSKDYIKLKQFNSNFIVIDYEHQLSEDFYNYTKSIIWSKNVKTF